MSSRVLQEAAWPARDGAGLWIKRAALVAFGVAALTVASKVKAPLPFSPVPVNLGTFAVLGLGAAYGGRLALVTLLAWFALGAAGFAVFAGEEEAGLAYMTGGTGGYLAGYLVATALVGALARRGWDRSPVGMAAAMLLGNVAIYALGLAWLSQFAGSWAQTLDWGLWPFLAGDALKLALAAVLLPAAWKAVGRARG
jgi:biotin transport system substrate-specific component